ncbi:MULTISPECIES: hypothetical protein [unclassified Hyphomicrobium]|uniref:hypothetical protein n=1 Tax=unclassified Hyphomicrobium TaxID=2619925 RepID=UPI000213EF38|nr:MULTISPECIES: hypothetical protein [unclassified Hyphomicrobium]CCB64150.1 FHA domain-containing protein [Hyphomicrobium sp. MC1]
MASPGTSAIAGPDLDPLLDDTEDLPRTLRREKEARAREARERAAQERAAAPTLSMGPDDRSRPQPQIYAASDFTPNAAAAAATLAPVSVRKIDVPFVELMLFFLKAVIASIPALILLGTVLWTLGTLLEMIFPWLIKMKILISFPN